MVGQQLSNKNKSATVLKTLKNSELNKALLKNSFSEKTSGRAHMEELEPKLEKSRAEQALKGSPPS